VSQDQKDAGHEDGGHETVLSSEADIPQPIQLKGEFECLLDVFILQYHQHPHGQRAHSKGTGSAVPRKQAPVHRAIQAPSPTPQIQLKQLHGRSPVRITKTHLFL